MERRDLAVCANAFEDWPASDAEHLEHLERLIDSLTVMVQARKAQRQHLELLDAAKVNRAILRDDLRRDGAARAHEDPLLRGKAASALNYQLYLTASSLPA